MRKSLPFLVLLAAASLPASSQEVVHALTGTVSSIDSASKTITVFQDNGSQGVFTDAGGKGRYAFDKKLAQQTTQAAAFSSQGAYAIVFYYGVIEHPTVVAVKSLGKGPFDSTEGAIDSFNSHDHSITVTDKSGALKTFKLAADSIAEGDTGAIEALKLQARKGDHVRIVSQVVDGAPTALFIRDI
jgi:hypothetical protein